MDDKLTPDELVGLTGANASAEFAYKCGHREARHAAAELALKADAKIERLRVDAERYRWLRDLNNMHAREIVRYYGDVEASELDAAIDAAMKADKEP